jgi:hypothetical protein
MVTASRSLILASILLLACNHQQTKHKPGRPAGPIPLAKAAIDTVTPTADGGVYITTIDSGLWYVRGVEAVRVHFNQPSAQHGEIVNPDLLEITPGVDGSAYATSPLSEGIWYLKEGQAYRVRESSGISSQAHKPSEDRFFGLYIAELKKRRSASEKADSDLDEQDDADYEQ